MPRDHRIVPVLVSAPIFLQNLDTSVMATALPTIADALDVSVLHLNLAITAYLLSLAVFLPASGWLSERYGARRIFCLAIGFFSLGSALCGVAQTLPQLVAFRVIQGLGGAMMLPVGRLILLRSVPPAQLLAAMVWYTVPPAFGRLIGPLFGGAIVTFASWRWIFLVNVPFGALAIAGVLVFVEAGADDGEPASFDLEGFVLMALGLTLLLGSLEIADKDLLSVSIVAAIGGFGALLVLVYHLRSRGKANPLIDFRVLRYSAFRAAVLGAMPLRVGLGAGPFLLPLLLQLAFGLSPLTSGLLTLATAVGSLGARPLVKSAIHAFGYRKLLITMTALTTVYYLACGWFRPQTPHAAIFGVLLFGGVVQSTTMVLLATLGFSQIPKPLMSHATTLNSMAQQLWLSVGVTLGAALVSLAAWWHGGRDRLQAADFTPAFVALGALTLLSLAWFIRLSRDEGAELR